MCLNTVASVNDDVPLVKLEQTWYGMAVKGLHFMLCGRHLFYELPETLRALKWFAVPC